MATRYDDRQRRFLERLKDARLASGLTQAAVAEHLGVTQSHVSKWENGECRLTFLDLEDLAELYHKPLTYFGTVEE